MSISYFQPSTLQPLKQWRPANNQLQPRQESWTVGTSQTIQYGDLLILSSGLAVQALATPGSDNTLTTSGGNIQVLGMAISNITTDSNGNDLTTAPGYTLTQVQVVILDNNVDFLLRCYNATASATQLQDLTRGTGYLLGRWRVTSTNVFYVFLTTTSGGEFLYMEPFGTQVQNNAGSLEQSITDTYAAVWGRMKSTANALL